MCGRHVFKQDPYCSKHQALFCRSRFRSSSMAFSIFLERTLLPAIPVITYSGLRQVLSTIRVPGSSGLLVFGILIRIPSLAYGKIASSWRTLAPYPASSRSSRYVIVSIGTGLFTTRYRSPGIRTHRSSFRRYRREWPSLQWSL